MKINATGTQIPQSSGFLGLKKIAALYQRLDRETVKGEEDS